MKIKNIVFLISVLIFIFPHNSFAADSNSADCSSRPTSDTIIDYIKDNRKILSNITKNLSGGNDTTTIVGKGSDAYDKIRSKGIGLYNSLFSWNGYESYLKFFVLYPLSAYDQEIPYEIMRDHKILQNENKTLEKLLEKLIKSNKDNSEITNPCDGIEFENDKCMKILGNKSSASDIIDKLIKNNRNLANLFRLSLLPKESPSDSTVTIKRDIFLIDTDEFTKDYNEQRMSKFSKDCGSWKKFGDKMDKILDWQKVTRKGIKQWDEALLRLRCSGTKGDGICSDKDNAKYKAIEKQLLKNELSRQGLSSNMNKKMLQNLENFNNTCKGDDLVSNAICGGKLAVLNSAKSVYNWDIQKGEDGGFIKNFMSAASGIIGKGLGKKENVSINRLANKNIETQDDDMIHDKIDKLFQAGMGSLGQNATEEDKLQAKIIDIHINLVESIKILEESAKIACKVSRSQGNTLADGCVD